MGKIAIIYGSSTSNTQNAAEAIAEKLSGNEVTLLDVSNVKAQDLEDYPNLILGTSTWGLGDLQDDWESFLPKLKSMNLEGKVVALFGLGDSGSYPDSFVDGMGILYEAIQDKGIKLIGQVSTEGYDYEDSKAVVDGKFVGLALDDDNESDKTNNRISAWVSEISQQLSS
ncbi:MAG: flavodoxin [Bacteroidales bacterium]|nr:flavodoxin [Bacteroidales bacterium]